MTFQNLYYFIEAARDLNFSKTAERLFVSPQSISKHLGKLEEHYSVKLFTRRPDLQLTEAGQLIATKAEQIFSIEKDINRKLAQMKLQNPTAIQMKCNLTKATVFLPTILKLYAEQYPGTQIFCDDSRTDELGDTHIQSELLNHSIHFYVGEQIPVESEDIIQRLLFRDRNLFAVSKQKYHEYFQDNTGLLNKSLEGVSPSDFGDLTFLLQEDSRIPSTHAYFLHNAGGLKRENCIIYNHVPLNMMLSMCRKNMGVILLSELLLYYYVSIQNHTLDDLYLFNASINGIPYYRNLYLCYSRDVTKLDQAVSDFPAIIQEEFQHIQTHIEQELKICAGCI